MGEIYVEKIFTNSRIRSRDPEKLPSFPNWKAINLGFPVFEKGIVWGIGNSARVNVWMDNWVNGDSLRVMIEDPLR